MQSILSVFDFLKGKKTYIVGTLTIVLGVLNGDNALILQGLAMFTLRSAIANK
jgi:hypothetical protein